MQSLFGTGPWNDLRLARHAEPHIDYLRRSGRPQVALMRDQITSWLDALPPSHRRQLIARLSGRDDHHFEAAFFELYLHVLFRGLGFGVQLHPRAGRGKRPDFLLSTASGSGILVEAATVDELSAAGRAARNRVVAIYDALNEIECADYFFHVDLKGEPVSPVPLGRLKKAVEDLVARTSYQAAVALAAEQRFDDLPRTEFECDGCTIGVSLFPVSQSGRGNPNHRPLGIIGPGEMAWVDDRMPIRNKIRSKSNRYGRVRRPLVIAINAAGRHVDHIDMMEALFGKETFQFPVDSRGVAGEPVMERIPDGAWTGRKGPQHRRVSAVLIVSSLLPWTMTVSPPCVYHNPWARYPIPNEFRRLASYAPSEQKMVFRPGEPVNQVLRLPARWPHHIADEP